MHPPTPHPLDTSRPVLVVGASGTLGRSTVTALVRHGAPVRALVRRPRPELSLPGVDQVVGDLRRPETVDAAMTGVAAAFYVSPHEDDEEQLAATFVSSAGRAGVRVVFAGVHVSSRTFQGRVTLQVMRVLFASYRPKLRIGQLVERHAPGAVLLVPTNFFDNDELFLADILDGRYPTPLKGMNRVAASDVGEAAARALLDPGFPAGTHAVCGPRTLSGADSARVWSQELGRPVAYTGDDPVAWERAADRRLPSGRKGRDYRASFRLLGRIAMATRPADVARTTDLLGRPPLDYSDYVHALATTATKETPSA